VSVQRVLKLARNIADLAGSTDIESAHIVRSVLLHFLHFSIEILKPWDEASPA
jgi:hypothetical protein